MIEHTLHTWTNLVFTNHCIYIRCNIQYHFFISQPKFALQSAGKQMILTARHYFHSTSNSLLREA